MNTLKIDGTNIAVPATWHELTPRQVAALCELLGHERAVLDVAMRALLILLDTPARPWLQLKLLQMSDEQRYNCLELAKWVFDPTTQLTRQLLPVLTVPGDLRRLRSPQKLHGPGDSFAGVAFQEFIQCEGYRHAYAQHGDVRELNHLVAALYRPARKGAVTAETATGDVREKYNDHLVAARALQVARLPLGQRLAVLRYYDSCRRHRIALYRATLFDAADEQANVAAVADPRHGWHKVLAELAGGVAHYDAIGDQPLDNVLFDLDFRITKARERNAEIEARSRATA